MSPERIEVSLGKSGGTKVFETIQELETWFNQERAFWSWLMNQQIWSEAKNLVSQRYAAFFGNVQPMLNAVKQIKQTSEAQKQPPNFQTYFTNIQQYFVVSFDNQLCSYSGTPYAKFVARLKNDEGELVAAGALAYSMRCPINSNHFESFRGALTSSFFESGISERKPFESQALEELRLEWENKFQIFRDTLQIETDTHKKLNADGGLLISNQNTALKELLSKQTLDLENLVVKSKTEWIELRKTYDDALAVRSPVTYWTKKAKSHLVLAWIYAFVAVVAAAASLSFLIPEVKNMTEAPKGILDPEKWHPEYWRLAVLIASVLFCVWVVRILVRLLLSNIHLLTDARERVTMVQTYLALLRRGKLKDDERMFILQTLFRPTPTGIVKDDAVPLTIVEGITKLGR